MQPVFQINNLRCAYIQGMPVLELHDLEIPRGKLIFVIGKSGIGKSTFIETLGLMNKTIAGTAETSMLFFPNNDTEGIELKDSWQLPNHELAQFRKSHFSFIFQNTNLMPNFTAGENMMMSLLIKGIPQSAAKEQVLKMMTRLSLPTDVFDKKITALSGGQRQRLAFVRAITADFTILFGDEPTGNLDDNTAHELMSILKQLIQEENKTGVIVSHDLKLASLFADVIIPITHEINNQGYSYGVVASENILRKEQGDWYKAAKKIEADSETFLNEYLGQNVLLQV